MGSFGHVTVLFVVIGGGRLASFGVREQVINVQRSLTYGERILRVLGNVS